MFRPVGPNKGNPGQEGFLTLEELRLIAQKLCDSCQVLTKIPAHYEPFRLPRLDEHCSEYEALHAKLTPVDQLLLLTNSKDGGDVGESICKMCICYLRDRATELERLWANAVAIMEEAGGGTFQDHLNVPGVAAYDRVAEADEILQQLQ